MMIDCGSALAPAEGMQKDLDHANSMAGQSGNQVVSAPIAVADSSYKVCANAAFSLQTITADARLHIFAMLPFTDFVGLMRVCKQWCMTSELDKLGRQTVCEMGRAVSGKDILTALLSNTFAAPMQPLWEGALLLSFARKTAHVALHDHPVVTEAWLRRFCSIKARIGDHTLSGIAGEIDALRWFAQSPQRRYAHSGDIVTELVSVARPGAKPEVSSHCMALILESMPPYHSHSVGNFRALDLRLRESARVMWLEIGEKNGRGCAGKVSLPLIRRYAWEWFVQEDLTTSISEVLSDKFGVTLDVQRRELDPYIAEKIAGFSAQTRTPIPDNCSRWRLDDATFNDTVEQYCLRHIPLDVLRGGAGIERYVGMEPRIRIRLWQFETANERIFRGDAVLAAQCKGLYDSIGAAADIVAWRDLLDASVQMPWSVAPLLMQHLACRLCVLARIARQRPGIESELPSLFNDFIAWRDRVAPQCVTEGAFDMAARAYAAPVSLTCEPWRVRQACRDASSGTSKHVDALLDAAQTGLAALSPRYWHEILETLFSRSLPLQCSVKQGEWMNQFLRSPDATARYPSTEFVLRIITHAVRIWTSLPDRALDTKTRLTVFCERFDLVGAQREKLRNALVDDIASRVSARVCRLDDALRDACFDDDGEMGRLVDYKIWHRALRVNTLDPELARLQFVRDTRGSAFLRNQAAIYLAGTTGEVVLEPE